MENIITEFYNQNVGQGFEDYEKSHRDRFNFLVEDLRLNEIKNSSILDVGCGYGPIFQRLYQKNNNILVGIDGAKLDNQFEYHIVDLQYDFFSALFNDKKFDYVFSFETFEHLSNPYHCLLEIKKLMHKDSIFYLSIPHESITHNTIYPSLLYPVDNFKLFLDQCAMQIIDHRQHNKAFMQNVLTLKSLGWEHSNMLWRKNDDKFRNIPPHISINL